MIVEHVVLPVRPGAEEEFEAAFATARRLIEASPGFISLRLLRGIESTSRYLFLVEWESLEGHETGFRGSAAYAEWSRLLHPFYDPFPQVSHFR